MADDLKDGLSIPVKVQTTGDAGAGAAEGIKKVKEETEKASAVIRDYATASESAAKSDEERAAAAESFAAKQKEWAGNGGRSGLASDPGAFRDAAGEAEAAKEAEREAVRSAAEARRASMEAQ